jgi:quaternary ammonium compound-resistance protein SugE
MAWIYLLLAAACEMVWPVGFKLTNGFTNWSKNWPVIGGTFAVMLTSFGFMSLASRTLPVGTVYAVWTGLGTAGIAVIGMVLFDEPRDVARILCLALIVVGVVGIKLLEKPKDSGGAGAKPEAALIHGAARG